MSVTAGTSFGLSVTAKDSSGNVDTSFDNTVTVALLSNPGGATLGGTLSVAAVDGVATFSALTLDQLGDGYTLRLSSDGLTSVTTNSFGVIPPTPVIPPTGSNAPTIIGLQYIGAKHNLILTFSEPMDATRAQVAASYRLVWAGKDHRLGTSDDRVMQIRSAQYDPAKQSVTLQLVRPLPLGRTYSLTVAGAESSGLTSCRWDAPRWRGHRPTGQRLRGADQPRDADGPPGHSVAPQRRLRDTEGPKVEQGSDALCRIECPGTLANFLRLGKR